jgi:hypothetical protein
MGIQQVKQVVSAHLQVVFFEPGSKQVQQLAGADARQRSSDFHNHLHDDFIFK